MSALQHATRRASTRLLSGISAPCTPGNPLDALGARLVAPQFSHRVSVDALGVHSFTVSGVRVRGSLLLSPFIPTLWNVSCAAEIRAHSLVLLRLIVPRPDMLLVGTGMASVRLPYAQEVEAFLAACGVGLDVMDSKNAAHTFNILNQEGRNVAAAMLPVAYQYEPEAL